MAATVFCPVCEMDLPVPLDSKKGDKIECPNWAGVNIQLVELIDGKWKGNQIPLVSCSVCDEIIELDDDVKNNDVIEHCGVKQKLTFEWGSYALEKI